MPSRELTGMAHFVLEYTEKMPGKGSYGYNQTLDVLAANIDRALTLFREEHPDADVHVIRKASRTKAILIDDPWATTT